MNTPKQGRGQDTTAAGGEAPREQFPWRVMTSAEFDQASYAPEWLVQSILLADQPAVVGGPVKSLKTSIALDMAISLGTGTKFLGRFKVPQAVRVAVFSAQSGEAALQETARRVAVSKGVKLKKADVLWSSDLPRLGRKGDLDRLHTFLEDHEVKVVIVDPLHLATQCRALVTLRVAGFRALTPREPPGEGGSAAGSGPQPAHRRAARSAGKW